MDAESCDPIMTIPYHFLSQRLPNSDCASPSLISMDDTCILRRVAIPERAIHESRNGFCIQNLGLYIYMALHISSLFKAS